ncbi:MAG: histidinol dehydrogenase [Pirellulales bacterium]|nr:histidinol dehydrogenase [Pirellulales bacterium]
MALRIRRLDTRSPQTTAELDALREKLSPRGDIVSEAGRKKTIEVFGEPLSPQQVVEKICSEVRDQGIDAVLDYSRRIDGADLSVETIRVSAEELAAAHKSIDQEFLTAVRRIRNNITRFQEALLPQATRIELDGGWLAQQYQPLARVGICVPGGAAAYPSTVLMTAVPAQTAGVQQIAVFAPPTPFGANNPHLLATCCELGVSEVYRLGGAQGVATMAFGVEGIPRVDKIVGPGNLFVALAKKHVYGEVDIDSIAGPSEVVVIADAASRTDWTAADLIAQAEHAPGSAILLSWDEAFVDQVYQELERLLGTLDRGDLARESLEAFGALVLVKDRDEACRLANVLATEHLHVSASNAESMLPQLKNAGAVFVGSHSPVAVGDYWAGPSHVLPTGGTARFTSGLSATAFLRSHSVIKFSDRDLTAAADDVALLASLEGLTAHRESVVIRNAEAASPKKHDDEA